MHIKVTKGLDIPIRGNPEGRISSLPAPTQISLDLKPFEETKFTLLIKVGDAVKIGQPLASDKDCPTRLFVSPAGGVVKEIRRGVKRRLLDIVIDVAQKEESLEFSKMDAAGSSHEQILERLQTGGMFSHIRQRPFNRLANPNKLPRNIFVKALESAPFVPAAELQVAGYEKDFAVGLHALSKLTQGRVHLVYRNDTDFQPFLKAEHVVHHTVEGPHPASNHSLHIEKIDPIISSEDVVWTLTAYDVVMIGHLLAQGRYLKDRVISIAGPGIIPGKTGYFKTRAGAPISLFVEGRIEHGWMRLISGDVLTGYKVESEDFLGFYDKTFNVVPEGNQREFLHFFRLGINKYSFSRAYVSGHLNNTDREYDFTTSQHGEERAFIDSTLYDKVMPMRVPTMPFIKALMAEDYDLAAELGLLEVASEDFALATFVDPSKIEMTEIVKHGLRRYAADVLQ